MIFWADYASPSAFESERERATLGLTANGRRPVRFHGRVRQDVFPLRLCLRALGELIWSSDYWGSDGLFVLDPVVTVHPDRLFFEAFSADQSAYGCLIVDPSLFETEGEVLTGTTNVDFTAWLWGALAELRSSRETWFRVGPEGLEVKTLGHGGRFEQKVDVPLPWVRGFLNMQGAAALPGTRLTLRPVDLLAALRFLRYTKARISPRALRYELQPGADARLVLEPWEQVVPLVGATHSYTEPRIIRTWGRRRLRLIEGLLPFADRVDVYLKGRALPSFYAVKLGKLTFVLGLSGFTEHAWTSTAGFGLLSGGDAPDGALLARARDELARRYVATAAELAEALGCDREEAARLLHRLCRQGRAVFDVERRAVRHRELFEEPPDEALVWPPDVRVEKAEALAAGGAVRLTSCQPKETRKLRKLPLPDGGRVERELVYRDWQVAGEVTGAGPVELVVNDVGSIIFGTCTCPFFRDNLLNQGPCEHMLALHQVSDGARRDLATSTEPTGAVPRPAGQPKAPPDDDADELDGDEDEEVDDA